MEIESKEPEAVFNPVSYRETKKISWKWRLKATFEPYPENEEVDETKKISWKWRLKGYWWSKCKHSIFAKQRKSPENGDWKRKLSGAVELHELEETKKISWKWRLKGDPFRRL